MSTSSARGGDRAKPEETLARIDEVLAANARAVAERSLSGSAHMEPVYAARQQVAARAAECP